MGKNEGKNVVASNNDSRISTAFNENRKKPYTYTHIHTMQHNTNPINVRFSFPNEQYPSIDTQSKRLCNVCIYLYLYSTSLQVGSEPLLSRKNDKYNWPTMQQLVRYPKTVTENTKQQQQEWTHRIQNVVWKYAFDRKFIFYNLFLTVK
jgi:hypothetical protein